MDETQVRVLREYGRFVAHMRAERYDNRFGLVFGAGISQPLDFPSWSQLVLLIADHPEVKARHVIASSDGNLPDTSKTQMLFQHYRSRELDRLGQAPGAKIERKIQGQWRRIIHECLYKKVPKTASELQAKHPYLKEFVEVVVGSSMTVNYNFDDTIQQLLLFDIPMGQQILYENLKQFGMPICHSAKKLQ